MRAEKENKEEYLKYYSIKKNSIISIKPFGENIILGKFSFVVS